MSKYIPDKVIVHHSLTKDSGTVSWGAIRDYHIRVLGWKDIGYHVGCESVRSGTELYNELLLGRMWDRPGAHTKGHNSNSLGICFIGNFDNVAPEKTLLKEGAKVIALWLKLFDLRVDDIYPHNYFNHYKSCPGKCFDMEQLKMYVKKELKDTMK